MDKIKEFFKSVWATIAAAVTVVGGMFLGFLYIKKKQDENNLLKTKDLLHEADKKSALIDQKVDQLDQDNAKIVVEKAKVESQVKDLEAKHNETVAKEKDRKEDQVEDYWKNN